MKRCGLGGFNLYAPLSSPLSSVHIHGWSPQEEQHIAKRHHFKAYSRLVEGVFACVVVSTMASGRPLNLSSSSSGTWHGDFRSLNTGARLCPAHEKEDLSSINIYQWRVDAISMSSGNQVQLGQLGTTFRICSSSSPILHSVCAMRHTCTDAGASCELLHPCWRNHREQWWISVWQTGLLEHQRINSKSPCPFLGKSPLSSELDLSWECTDLMIKECDWLTVTSGGRQVVTCDGSRHCLNSWCMPPMQCGQSGPTCACPEPEIKTASGLIAQPTILGQTKSPV